MIFLMILTSLCFAICTLSDRYVSSKTNINKNEFTFLVSMSMVAFLTITLPFSEVKLSFSLINVLLLLGIIIVKYIELLTVIPILKKMTGSELKAWLGTASIITYFYEILFLNKNFKIISIIGLLVLLLGLYIIAKDEKNKTNYSKIFFPLTLLIISKALYGIFINKLTVSFSSNITLIIIFFIISILMLRKVKLKEVFIKGKKTTKIICGTRIIDVIGNLSGNYVALHSVTNYALVQPVQLIILLFIEIIIKDRKVSCKNIIGSVFAIFGIIIFQLSSLNII